MFHIYYLARRPLESPSKCAERIVTVSVILLRSCPLVSNSYVTLVGGMLAPTITFAHALSPYLLRLVSIQCVPRLDFYGISIVVVDRDPHEPGSSQSYPPNHLLDPFLTSPI